MCHLKPLEVVVLETKLCHVIDQALKQTFRKTKQLVVSKRGIWFQNGGTMCPLDSGAAKKPGLDRVKDDNKAQGFTIKRKASSI